MSQSNQSFVSCDSLRTAAAIYKADHPQGFACVAFSDASDVCEYQGPFENALGLSACWGDSLVDDVEWETQAMRDVDGAWADNLGESPDF